VSTRIASNTYDVRRVRDTARRHPVIAWIVVLVVGTLVGGLWLSSWSYAFAQTVLLGSIVILVTMYQRGGERSNSD